MELSDVCFASKLSTEGKKEFLEKVHKMSQFFDRELAKRVLQVTKLIIIIIIIIISIAIARFENFLLFL